jgi:hypothetical protein
MRKNHLLLFAFCVSVALLAGCSTKNIDPSEDKGQAEKAPLLPVSGDYTFLRYVEDKEHTEYRVLYSQVPDSKIVQVKTVQKLDSTEISETNNFYEELKDGIYGYMVLSEDFPIDWTAEDVQKFKKTKIIAYPLEVGNTWTEDLEDLGVSITYHLRSIDSTLETPAKTFNQTIVIDFEEKDKKGEILRKGTSTYVPQVGWVRHETEAEYLKDIHELVKINES